MDVNIYASGNAVDFFIQIQLIIMMAEQELGRTSARYVII